MRDIDKRKKYYKKYAQEKKDEISEQKKKYYLLNKERIKQREREARQLKKEQRVKLSGIVAEKIKNYIDDEHNESSY